MTRPEAPRRWRCRLIWMAALVVNPPAASAQATADAHAPARDWFLVNHWDRRSGVPPGSITALLQTRDGYMWIATRAGVARFDGLRFTVFDDRDRSQLPENEVKALAEGDDGSLWIATYGGGVSRLLRGRFTIYTKRDGLPSDFVSDVAKDREGAIWFATDEGIGRYHQGRFERFQEAAGVRPLGMGVLYPDPGGTLWVAGRNATVLHSVKAGRGVRFVRHIVEELPAGQNVSGFLRTPDGAMWVSTYGGLYRFQGGAIRRYASEDGLAGFRVNDIHRDRDGTMWAVANDTLHRLVGDRFRPYNDLQATRGLSLVTSDAEGSVWINREGLSLLRRGQFIGYTPEQGLAYHYVTSIAEDAAGHIWVASSGQLNHITTGRPRVFGNESGLPGRIIGGLAFDARQVLWVGTDIGLYRSTGPLPPDTELDRLRFELVPGQPAGVQTRALLFDRQGTLWIATLQEGLVRYRDGLFTVFTTRDGLLHNAVRGLREDRAGNLWLGTRAGLNRFSGGTFTGYGEAQGLVHPTIEALHLDQRDRVWAGTRQGVCRLDGARFHCFRTENGLLANYVTGFADDGLGRLWMGAGPGVFYVPHAALDEFALGRLAAFTSTSYGREHGLPTHSLNAGFDRLIHRASDGRLWFGFNRGLAVVDPRRLDPNTRPPPVDIQEVRIDRRQYATAVPDMIQAPPGRGELSFRYAGLSFVAPEKMRFRHRLEGYDPDWIDGDESRGAHYTNIAPGRYTFRVIASNNDGVWNTTGMALGIVLEPHWYQTWLFRLTVLGLALALGAGLYRNHMRQLTRRQRLLEQRVAERTAELASANQELDAFTRSVSHDLRAPLRSIEGFTREVLREQGDALDADSRDLLGRVEGSAQRMAVLIDDLLELSRSARADLARKPVSLTALAEEILGELGHQDPNRRVEAKVAPDLVTDADPNLMRVVLQNLLGNAWKFTSKRPTAHIEVGATSATETAYYVRDDGAGFDPTFANLLFRPFKRLHAPSDFEGTGIGLATVRRIIERHGGKVWAEGQPDQGATFYFTLPKA